MRHGTATRKTRGQFSFARRAFTVSLIGICTALSVSFLAVSLAIRSEIKAGIKDSLWQTQQSRDQFRSGQNSQAAVVLQMVSANPMFEAAIRQAAHGRRNQSSRQRAQKILTAHLDSARSALGSDWAAVSDSRGKLLAFVRESDLAVTESVAGRAPLDSGIRSIEGILYDVAASPVISHGRAIGALAIGTRFDFGGIEQLGPAALLYKGRLIRSTLPARTVAQIEGAMHPDCARIGCELRIDAEDLLVMPVASTRAGSPGDDYQLLSFRSINRVMDDILNRFRTLVPVIGICTVLLAICISALASRAVSRPIKELIARLGRSEVSGTLRPDFPEDSPTREVNLLAASLNEAATVVEQSKQQLNQAYIEFLETMAQALDARDPYTAGHSNRVRDYAIAIASAMQLPPEEIEIIRVGAQLHDIGKIGIPDDVLQKAGFLTPEEYELVKLHPQIGKRILERVAQFDKYLPIVELHHEDQDGGGYPYGLKGQDIPLAVRIVHVADVFDALTSNRAYRLAMPLPTALEMIEICSGAQFDPEVVRTFSAIVRAGGFGAPTEIEQLAGLANS